MLLRSSLSLLLCGFALTTAGCATYIGRAEKSYAEGRYLETEERLGKHEIDVPYLAQDNQCLYGLYRGMALLALGDREGAQRWLAFAYDVERQNPSSLKPHQRATLERAWYAATSARPGEALVVPR